MQVNRMVKNNVYLKKVARSYKRFFNNLSVTKVSNSNDIVTIYLFKNNEEGD
jgi:hypothetical protein